MRNDNGTQVMRSSGDLPAPAVLALLASVGLQAEGVARCPDPACPLCTGTGRVAA